MGRPPSPTRVVLVGLSLEELAVRAESLGTQVAVVEPGRSAGVLCSPDTALAILDISAAAQVLSKLESPASPIASCPPLLVLYDPRCPEEVEQARSLASRHVVDVLAKTGDLAVQLPLAAQVAAASGRLLWGHFQAVADRVAELAAGHHRLGHAVECMSEGLLVLGRDYQLATINPVAGELLGVASLDELSRRLSADEIDPGLHPIFWLEAHDVDAKPLRCWEALGCGQEACPAHGSGLFPCWLYDGTLCHGAAGEAFPAKLATCYECRVYQSNARVDDPARARGRREVTVERPTKRVLESRSAPILDEAGEFLGVVKLLRDITAERMLERVRAEFASFITHELRTPLTSISGFLALLLGERPGPLTDLQRRQLEAASRQSERLRRLVDDLLDLSAIEARRLLLRYSRFDLARAAREAVEMLRPQATAAEVALRVEPAEEPLAVVADRERILHVLTNLVDNAIKYTGPGGLVTVRVRPGEAGVRVEVVDTGRGIPPAEVPRLFDKYYRVLSGALAPGRGSGLGLAICRGILDAHGGSIGVESTVGRGSRFHFTLPRRPLPPSA